MGWIEGSLGHVQCDGCSRVTKDRFAGKHPATKGDALHLPPIVSSPPAVAGRRRKSRREQPAATGKKHERVRTPQRRVEKRRNVERDPWRRSPGRRSLAPTSSAGESRSPTPAAAVRTKIAEKKACSMGKRDANARAPQKRHQPAATKQAQHSTSRSPTPAVAGKKGRSSSAPAATRNVVYPARDVMVNDIAMADTDPWDVGSGAENAEDWSEATKDKGGWWQKQTRSAATASVVGQRFL